MKLVWKKNKLNDTPVVSKSPQSCKERAFSAALKKKGSLTIEAALSLPIFLFFVIAVFYFLMIIFLQSDIQLRMEETARSMGKQAYLIERMDGLTSGDQDQYPEKRFVEENRQFKNTGRNGWFLYLSFQL